MNLEKCICLGRAEIKDHIEEMVIPEGATLIRTKGRYAKFFKGKKPEGSRNGWSYIPEGKRKVIFPYYRLRSGKYGHPEYS